MKTSLEIKPKTSLKTKTIFVLKVAAAVGIVGTILTGIFFAISYFGTPKTSLADNINNNSSYTGVKTIIISEVALKGHDGEKRDQFIELYNFSDTAINLSGYSLVYTEINKNKTKTYSVNLSGNIATGSYFVVALNNGSKSKDQPTSDLSYDFIIPSDGWNVKKNGYLKLNNGSITIDNAGSSSNNIKKNKNYDRTDILVDGIATDIDWTEVHKNSSTPGIMNISDLPSTNNVNPTGTTVEFGSNSNNNPAISIKSNGTISPGTVTVKVKRGKKPTSNFQMIKRSVEIDPTVQPDNIELVFYYHESELNGLAETDLALYSYYNNTWHYVGGVVDPINNKITATGVNHFSEWSAGPSSASSLPVSLLSFEGEFANESVMLAWETATEEHNDYFTIEHSKDGINYEEIGTQIGAGNSNSKIQYTMIDENPFDELTYYRLKQTDYDGKFEVFPAIAVRKSIATNNITIDKYGPNPFTDGINIYMSSNITGTVQVKLYNMQGSVLRNIDYQCQIGQNTILLSNLDDLLTGTYLVQIYSNSHATEAIRLIKQ